MSLLAPRSIAADSGTGIRNVHRSTARNVRTSRLRTELRASEIGLGQSAVPGGTIQRCRWPVMAATSSKSSS